MSAAKDPTAAERQRRFRQRQRDRNGTVTAAIAPGFVTADTGGGIAHRNGHTYYTWADGRVYAVVCCGRTDCPLCTSASAVN